MRYILKEMSDMEKPREKLKRFGSNSLSDYELLSIILKTGTKNKSVIDLSIELMNYIENITNISDLTITELKEFKGIGEAKALEIIASIEIGKRLLNKTNSLTLKCSKDIYDYIKYDLVNEKQENFLCIYLDLHLKIIAKKIISKGSLNEASIDLQSSIKWGLKYSCYGIIFIHNHPSGNPTPSKADDYVNNRFISALEAVGLKYIDHIIIGRKSYYSYVRNNIYNE